MTSAASKIVISAIFASAGIALGILPPNVSQVLQIIGACETIRAAADLWKATSPTEEIRTDPFFYLWRVQRHERH